MKIWLFSLNVGLLLIISACGEQQSSDEDSNYSSLRSTGVEKRQLPTPIHTTEAGGTATIQVRLNSMPLFTVTIIPSSSNTDEGTLSPSSLEFSTSNWDTSQTATVTGVDDSIDPVVDGNTSYKINQGNTVSSSTHYHDLKSGTLELSNTDSESSGVTLSSSLTNKV